MLNVLPEIQSTVSTRSSAATDRWLSQISISYLVWCTMSVKSGPLLHNCIRMPSEKACNRWITSKVNVIGILPLERTQTYNFLLVFYCNQISTPYHFQDISYFPNSKRSCDPDHIAFGGSLSCIQPTWDATSRADCYLPQPLSPSIIIIEIVKYVTIWLTEIIPVFG